MWQMSPFSHTFSVVLKLFKALPASWTNQPSVVLWFSSAPLSKQHCSICFKNKDLLDETCYKIHSSWSCLRHHLKKHLGQTRLSSCNRPTPGDGLDKATQPGWDQHLWLSLGCCGRSIQGVDRSTLLNQELADSFALMLPVLDWVELPWQLWPFALEILDERSQRPPVTIPPGNSGWKITKARNHCWQRQDGHQGWQTQWLRMEVVGSIPRVSTLLSLKFDL